MDKQEFQGKENAGEEEGRARGRASQVWKKHWKFIDEVEEPQCST